MRSAGAEKEIRDYLAEPQPPLIELIQLAAAPTSLSRGAEWLTFIFDHFDCSNLKEVIVEGFPNSMTNGSQSSSVPKLKLNIGVQSFHFQCPSRSGASTGAFEEGLPWRSHRSNCWRGHHLGLPSSTPATVG